MVFSFEVNGRGGGGVRGSVYEYEGELDGATFLHSPKMKNLIASFGNEQIVSVLQILVLSVVCSQWELPVESSTLF